MFDDTGNQDESRTNSIVHVLLEHSNGELDLPALRFFVELAHHKGYVGDGFGDGRKALARHSRARFLRYILVMKAVWNIRGQQKVEGGYGGRVRQFLASHCFCTCWSFLLLGRMALTRASYAFALQ